MKAQSTYLNLPLRSELEVRSQRKGDSVVHVTQVADMPQPKREPWLRNILTGVLLIVILPALAMWLISICADVCTDLGYCL